MTEELLIPSVTLLAAFLFQQKQGFDQRQKNKQDIQTGLVLLGHMQKVMELTQKHRGLSNAMYLSGEQFDSQLQDIQQQMGKLIHHPNSKELQQFEQWQSFVDHWPRLVMSTNTKKLTASQSMRQHSAMVETQLYLLDEFAHHYGLDKIKLDRMSHMLGLCIDTLRTAESIAKARGMGTGLCGQHSEQSADVISLSFIKQNLSVTSQLLFKDLLFVDNRDLKNYFEQSTETITQSVAQLINVIEDKVLNPKEVVETQDYFKIATVPISQLLEVYNAIIKYVANQYSVKY